MDRPSTKPTKKEKERKRRRSSSSSRGRQYRRKFLPSTSLCSAGTGKIGTRTSEVKKALPTKPHTDRRILNPKILTKAHTDSSTRRRARPTRVQSRRRAPPHAHGDAVRTHGGGGQEYTEDRDTRRHAFGKACPTGGACIQLYVQGQTAYTVDTGLASVDLCTPGRRGWTPRAVRSVCLSVCRSARLSLCLWGVSLSVCLYLGSGDDGVGLQSRREPPNPRENLARQNIQNRR